MRYHFYSFHGLIKAGPFNTIVEKETSTMVLKLYVCLVLLSIALLSQLGATVDIGFHRVIKNSGRGITGLQLEGGGNKVTAKEHTDSFLQSWELEPTNTGTFYILNKKTKKILAVEGDVQKGNSVITTDERIYANKSQQWYINSDGTLVNALDKTLAIEVTEDNSVVVNTLDREKKGQQFEVFGYTILN